MLFFKANLDKCKVLDYGSGKGHITIFFLDRGIEMWGCDVSPEAVNYCNDKFKGFSNFHKVSLFDGRGLPYEDDFFDFVICTECIEHVLPEHMNNLLDEIYRILVPGGIILITTPNEEDMKKAEIYCPQCDMYFHKYGHVGRYSKESLTELMEEHKYKTVMCQGTDFMHYQKYVIHPSYLDMSIRGIKEQLKKEWIKLTDKKRGMDSKVFKKITNLKKNPNLFYIGTK